MTIVDYARLVEAMRAAQKAYFAARRRGEAATGELEVSKGLERQVDKVTMEINDRSIYFDWKDDA